MKTLVIYLSVLISMSVSASGSLDIEQVAPGVFVHFGKSELPDKANHGAIANIGFIVGKNCVAVIDSGGNPEQGYALKNAITKTTDTAICYVINTHVHPDHIYGNIAFKQSGVQFIGHHKLARAMSTRGSYYLDKARDQLDIQLSQNDLIPPDIEVNKHMVLDLGGRKLILTAHPTAHTDNDLTVRDVQTNTMWMSDLLFLEHLPVIDGSLLGWLKEIDRMEHNQYDRVIPGHGPLVTDWPKSIEPEKTYLTKLASEIRTMIKQGVFLEQAIEKVGYSEQAHWLLFDEFHKRNVTTSYAELEWED